MSGHGGWPMTVFLTPGAAAVLRRHLLPARRPRHGHAGFPMLLERSHEAWTRAPRRRRSSRPARSAEASRQLATYGSARGRRRCRATTSLRRGAAALARRFDPDARRLRQRARSSRTRWTWRCCSAACRGRGDARRCAMAPPHARRRWPAAASTTSSAAGSTATASTQRWLVPHFEKMLYDNALLARTYSRGVPGRPRDPLYAAESRRETLRLRSPREMTDAGRRLLLHPGRRQRGRGGEVLRLEPGGARGCARCGGRSPRSEGIRGHGEGNVRAWQERPRAPCAVGGPRPGVGTDRGRGAELARVRPHEAPRGAVEAHRSRSRRQDPRRMERPDDPRPGPRLPGVRPPRVGRASRPRRGCGAGPAAPGRPPAPRVPGRDREGGRLPRGLGRARLGSGRAVPGDARAAMARGRRAAGRPRPGAVLGCGAEGVPDRASGTGGSGGGGVRAPRQRGARGGEPADRGQRRARGTDRSPGVPRAGRGVPLADAGHRAGEPIRLRAPLVRGGLRRGRSAGRDAGRRRARAPSVPRAARTDLRAHAVGGRIRAWCGPAGALRRLPRGRLPRGPTSPPTSAGTSPARSRCARSRRWRRSCAAPASSRGPTFSRLRPTRSEDEPGSAPAGNAR